jgi:MFS family permease
MTLIVAGVATMLAPLCNSNVATHMTYGAFFGFFSGGYVGLTSIIIVDLVGVDKLSDAFGVLLLFQGIAVALGTPIVGEITGRVTKQRAKETTRVLFLFRDNARQARALRSALSMALHDIRWVNCAQWIDSVRHSNDPPKERTP